MVKQRAERIHRIYMIPSQTYGYALLSTHEDEVVPAGTTPGLWSRLKARYLKWTESTLAQERSLKKARKAACVEVCYPSGMTLDEAKSIFEKRVRAEMKHHVTWLCIDFPLLIPAALAMFIPGPNVFFLFWAIRIMGHYHAWEGGKRMLERGAIELHASHDLGEWQHVLRDKISGTLAHALARLEKKTGLRNLAAVLIKKRSESP